MLKKRKYKILVVDDDKGITDLCKTILEANHHVYTVHTVRDAKRISREEDFQVILLDLGLPDGNGMDLIPYFKELNEHIEIIVITTHQQVKLAVQAIQQGAFDFIGKEFDPEEMAHTVNNALEKYLRQKKIELLETEMDRIVSDGFVPGHSPKMQKVYEMVDKTAKVNVNALITGESGTGKEIIARRIHHIGSNSDAPFIPVNVASMPSELVETTLFGHEKGAFTGAHRLHYGKFELADGGTLFLDEIADLRIDLQAKLLRALQEQVIERLGGTKRIPVNVRVIAATNADLEQKVKEGEFREDLYYRLNVVRIHLPPLRERCEDIPDFVRYFIKKYNAKFKRNIRDISDLVLSIFKNYSWPGNIRELENIVERMIVLSEKSVITEGDVPIEYLVSDFDALKKKAENGDVLAKASEAFERTFILRVLEKEQWNQTRTAIKLGIHRKTLEYKVKKHDLGPIITQKRPQSRLLGY